MIHTFHLDREKGRLEPPAGHQGRGGSDPSLRAFHPAFPVFYANYERNTVVHGYGTTSPAGGWNAFHAKRPLFPDDVPSTVSASSRPPLMTRHPKTRQKWKRWKRCFGPRWGAPIARSPPTSSCTPDGKCLYVSTRFMNTISVLDVDGSKALSRSAKSSIAAGTIRADCVSRRTVASCSRPTWTPATSPFSASRRRRPARHRERSQGGVARKHEDRRGLSEGGIAMSEYHDQSEEQVLAGPTDLTVLVPGPEGGRGCKKFYEIGREVQSAVVAARWHGRSARLATEHRHRPLHRGA